MYGEYSGSDIYRIINFIISTFFQVSINHQPPSNSRAPTLPSRQGSMPEECTAVHIHVYIKTTAGTLHLLETCPPLLYFLPLLYLRRADAPIRLQAAGSWLVCSCVGCRAFFLFLCVCVKSSITAVLLYISLLKMKTYTYLVSQWYYTGTRYLCVVCLCVMCSGVFQLYVHSRLRFKLI